MYKEQDPLKRVLTTDLMTSKVLQASGNALGYPDDMFRGYVEAYIIVLFARLDVLDVAAKAGDKAGVHGENEDEGWRDVAPSAPMGTVHVGEFLESTTDETMKMYEGGFISLLGYIGDPFAHRRRTDRAAAMGLVNEWIGAAIADDNPQPF